MHPSLSAAPKPHTGTLGACYCAPPLSGGGLCRPSAMQPAVQQATQQTRGMPRLLNQPARSLRPLLVTLRQPLPKRRQSGNTSNTSLSGRQTHTLELVGIKAQQALQCQCGCWLVRGPVSDIRICMHQGKLRNPDTASKTVGRRKSRRSRQAQGAATPFAHG